VSYYKKFLDDKGFIEVETPMMQSIPAGRREAVQDAPRGPGHDLYLRIAPELYLKRLLSADWTGI